MLGIHVIQMNNPPFPPKDFEHGDLPPVVKWTWQRFPKPQSISSLQVRFLPGGLKMTSPVILWRKSYEDN